MTRKSRREIERELCDLRPRNDDPRSVFGFHALIDARKEAGWTFDPEAGWTPPYGGAPDPWDELNDSRDSVGDR